MDLSGDDLAGVVDLFGALTRSELADALAELAFKAGEDDDPAAFESTIEAALRTYHLVVVDDALDGGEGSEGSAERAERAAERAEGTAQQADVADDVLLVPGPVAFPRLPEGATDLPHILDVPERSIDRETAGRAAEARFRSDAARAVGRDAQDRVATLLDVSYELEAWAPVDLDGARNRLDAALED